jgi:hypothetical protein
VAGRPGGSTAVHLTQTIKGAKRGLTKERLKIQQLELKPGDREVRPHHELDRERLGAPGHGHARVRHVEHVVLHHQRGLLKPEVRQLVEQIALEGERGEDVVEGRKSIGGDQHQLIPFR